MSSQVPIPAGTKVPNTNTVVLPPIVPQAAPSGSDEVGKQSAPRVAACVAQRDCSNVVGTKVEWPGGDLSNMDFSYAQLTGADLRGVNAANTNFAGANLSGANLAGANLSGANLSGADLPGTDLTNADLSGANLRGATLTDAILSGADLQATFYCETVMPDRSIKTGQCER